jgi:nucleoside-diphosphate-sugar epimerase
MGDARRTALVVGGTGPTGPHIVNGMLERGYEVTLFHRGFHESDELPPVEHIHGDPHFRETIEESLAGRDFDVVLALYGRIRFLAEVMSGRCQQFVSVGGAPGIRGQMAPERVSPFGLMGVLDEHAPTVSDPEESNAGYKIAITEQQILELHDRGAFSATHLRYPQIYGPRQVTPREWSVVRRVLDGRRTMIVPDGGLVLRSRSSARNAAHAVLLAVDEPAAGAGRLYNVAEDEQYTVRQWHELVAAAAGGEVEIVSLPEELARPFHSIPRPRNHMLLDTRRIRDELGYRDVISTRDAIQETVDHLIAEPVTATTHPMFPDRFDYAAEDDFLAEYQRSIRALQAIAPEAPEQAHSYAHPKAKNERDRHGR